MKVEHHDIPQDNKVTTAEQRQVTAKTLVGRIKPHPGHTVFEFDLATGEIQPAKIETVTAEASAYKGVNTIRKVVKQRPNCLYCSALNMKNAIKHFSKQYAQLKASGQIVKGGDDA